MDGPFVDRSSGGYLQRTFNAGRASLSALDSKREADLRQQIKTAVFGETTATKDAMTTTTKSNAAPTQPAKLVKRQSTTTLKSKRRVSLSAATPSSYAGKQYITATYAPPASKPYDTYSPLQYDPYAVTSPADVRVPSRLPLRKHTANGPYTPIPLAPKSTNYLVASPTPAVEGSALDKPSSMYSTTGPTVTVKPIQPQIINPSNGLYNIDEQSPDQYDGDFHYFEPTKRISNYPMYSGLQTASPQMVHQAPRRVLNQPKRLSGNAKVSATVTTQATRPAYAVRESAKPEMRISTWVPHVNDVPSLASPRSPHSPISPRVYNRPETLKRRGPSPDERFEALPGEILRLVLERLKDLHLSPGSDSCATCWMRDASSVSLASRKWAKYARAALYGDIQIVGSDSAIQKKKFKMSQGGRLLLLRRTLRSSREIAGHVRLLKVPALELPAKGSPAPKAVEQYDDLISTLIMACPNLERLDGPFTRYDHTFKRIFHALSTRSQLRHMDLLIEASPAQHRQQRGLPKSPTRIQGLLMPEDLDQSEEGAWLDMHANWTELTNLSVHCLPGATLTPLTLLPETLTHLPSLQHLHLCNLPVNAFNDDNLLALPRLKTLTLSHISGITSTGLSTFATRATSLCLETLTLRHTSLASLPALARIFSNLSSLKTFSFIQAFSPSMPDGDLFSLWMMPYLASSSMRNLHWDITSISSSGNAANSILAKSIAAGGFPCLKSLRAPNDPEGLFQDLCRPVERIELPSDRFRVQDLSRAEDSSPPSSPLGIGFLSKSSTSSSLATSSSTSSIATIPDHPAACTSLRTARLAAQARLEAARSTPRFRVNVTAEEGNLVDAFDMAGFIGTVGSQILYNLHPDFGSTDEKGGLVDVRDLGGDSGESLMSSNGRGGETAREGCSGFWNRVDGVVADKKERERWFHTERGRWRRLEL